ncbi:sensor histidine kinase [Amycolatopsis suaedae]|uniref:histidine kinase n=1 Tax=Amycolatopsis suaedae TaxID=2510978 RepID=A0A4Q7IYY6_9PSEU|nr:sensor histidine kinase [Amycolatopsis suaedae]RZQ59482.1 sensor histidine kinase [Amycolatopsis suaedae]
MRTGSAGLLMVGLGLSAGVTVMGAFALVMALMSFVAFGLGLILVPLGLLGLRAWADLHRVIAGRILGTPVPTRLRPLSGGIGNWWRQLLTDPTTWRELLWIPVQAVVGTVLGMGMMFAAGVIFAALWSMATWWTDEAASVQFFGIVMDDPARAYGIGIPVVVLGVAALVLVLPALATSWATMTRTILHRGRMEQLEDRVGQLAETRSGAVHAHGAELRRIERDLHDGTQAQLVSIALRLGLAKEMVRDDPEQAAQMLADAQRGTEYAMEELRGIVRTIYPPILSDRGLNGALRSLVADAAVPTRLDLPDPEELGTLPAAIEGAAYFVVAEALTNVAKHSGASVASVSVSRMGDRLTVVVVDDGRGGVVESAGTGVTGIRRRVAALDGSATVDSPAGGPTVLTVELPCAP